MKLKLDPSLGQTIKKVQNSNINTQCVRQLLCISDLTVASVIITARKLGSIAKANMLSYQRDCNLILSL